MKQIVITKYGDTDVLKIQERFEQAGEAHAYIEARKNIGKIVLVTGD